MTDFRAVPKYIFIARNRWAHHGEEEPMKQLFVAAAVLVGVGISSPAFAKHCPKDAAIIDQALAKGAGYSKMQMSEAKTMRDKGMALHKSGNHGEAIKVLHAATKLLGIEPYKP